MLDTIIGCVRIFYKMCERVEQILQFSTFMKNKYIFIYVYYVTAGVAQLEHLFRQLFIIIVMNDHNIK